MAGALAPLAWVGNGGERSDASEMSEDVDVVGFGSDSEEAGNGLIHYNSRPWWAGSVKDDGIRHHLLNGHRRLSDGVAPALSVVKSMDWWAELPKEGREYLMNNGYVMCDGWSEIAPGSPVYAKRKLEVPVDDVKTDTPVQASEPKRKASRISTRLGMFVQ